MLLLIAATEIRRRQVRAGRNGRSRPPAPVENMRGGEFEPEKALEMIGCFRGQYRAEWHAVGRLTPGANRVAAQCDREREAVKSTPDDEARISRPG